MKMIGLSPKLNNMEQMGLFGASLIEKNQKYVSHTAALELGYIVDKEHDVYVLDGYGSFVTNIDGKIKSIEGLKTFKGKYSGTNTYQEYVDLIEQGYEFVLGPMFPASNGEVFDCGTGLYCKNYLEIAEQQKNEDGISV